MVHHPGWLEALLDLVTDGIECHGPEDALGFRYREEDGTWEVFVYPTPVELVGGDLDGTVISPGFSLDLELAHSAFDQVVAVTWMVCEGQEILIEGVYDGHPVVLHLLAEAPDDEAPGMQVDVGAMDATAPDVN